jgi:central glycolytic genes regulator
MEIQANSIAAAFAKGLGASYRLLHVPDALGPEAMQSILGEPKIKEILDLLRRADIVLHGIGAAEEMAARRGMETAGIGELVQKGAVGEAFGYYFDIRGNVVHSTSSVGLRLEELSQMGEVIAVSGGHSKASAAAAVLSCHMQDVFITDEGLARELSLFLKDL